MFDSETCPIQRHLCHGECISIDVACEGQADQDLNDAKESKLRRASIGSGYIVLIVCTSLFVIITVVLLIVYAVKRRRRNSLTSRPLKLMIRSDSVGIQVPMTGSTKRTETDEQN
ncbi:hypothetical protein RF11_07952 [Thelohanellus kitauei]|uniref:Uncharacterized protein n=1 Tax=Thelohanellus kitauei TaxID=669202 RepID=A0A0C2MME8_THEKT|nr:hypothetical protein RF11_07952 [Thelohanellus kitauei]